MSVRYIAGLDIGTTKVCAAVARVEGDGLKIVGYGQSPSGGLKRGVVVDIDITAEAVRKAVSEAGASSGVHVRAAYIGVTGSHVQCIASYGATGIKGKEVTKRDVDRVLESAAAMYVPLDREVLQVLPVDYAIDGQQGIVRPMGMSGVRLEANVHVVTASHSAVDNLVKCCERAGLDVIEAVFEPIAFSRAVAREAELDSGVVVIDMGGDVTNVAIYRDGALRHVSMLPVGGMHITNDIAIGLRLSREEAERVKRKYGQAVGEGPGEIETKGMDGQARKTPGMYLTEIIRPRCEEIFSLIRRDAEQAMLHEHPSCAVLTGGGALLKDLDRVAEASLGLPVRVGMPDNGLSSPLYSTCAGVALHGYETERNAHEHVFTGMLGRAGEWARKLFEVKGWGFGSRKTVRIHNP